MGTGGEERGKEGEERRREALRRREVEPPICEIFWRGGGQGGGGNVGDGRGSWGILWRWKKMREMERCMYMYIL